LCFCFFGYWRRRDDAAKTAREASKARTDRTEKEVKEEELFNIDKTTLM